MPDDHHPKVPRCPACGLSPLMDAKQLAEFLSIPVGLVYRLSSEGRIPKVKIGHRTVRFDPWHVLQAFKVDAVRKAESVDQAHLVDHLMASIP